MNKPNQAQIPYYKSNKLLLLFIIQFFFQMWWIYIWACITVAFAKQKPVTVSLNAKWSSTPLLLEAR